MIFKEKRLRYPPESLRVAGVSAPFFWVISRRFLILWSDSFKLLGYSQSSSCLYFFSCFSCHLERERAFLLPYEKKPFSKTIFWDHFSLQIKRRASIISLISSFNLKGRTTYGYAKNFEKRHASKTEFMFEFPNLIK